MKEERKEVSAEQQTPPTAQEMGSSVQKEEEKKKKKGCLFGCLGAVILVLVIVVGLGVWGFKNRNKALPFVAARLGTKIEKGLPSGYGAEAYKIDLPEAKGNLKVSITKAPASEANQDFLDYYKSEGWTVSREMREMPADLETIAAFGEVEGSITMLEKDGRGVVITAMGYNGESTVLVMEVDDIQELMEQ
ncbi:MAG: hypothetical protein U9R36_00990 [Elusimicrobiota bacterium]|nr:hypothetical protein [Elusimicrobiota bacterium]